MLKKILFLVTQSEFGGAQRFIFEMATHLNPQKYEILVAAGSPAQISSKFVASKRNGELFEKISNLKSQNSKLNLKCQSLKYLKRVPNPIRQIQAIAEIVSIIRKEKPDVLFLCSTTAGFLGSIAAKIYKLTTKNYQLKTIYRIGGWAFRDPRPFFLNWLIFLAEKWTSPLKDKVIVNSEIDRQLAMKYKICPAEKIIKIYNGIEINQLNFLPKEEARRKLFQFGNLTIEQFSNLAIVGCVANFYKTKGLPYLIEAAHLLNSKFEIRNSKFVIIGEGSQRPQLESLIKKYNLENQVFLLGRIPDAYKYLKAFDVFVLPSLKEGFPWIILEAMAAEVPIVATKVGALSEIIEDGREGFLVEPKNPKIITEKISWVLNHPEQIQEMTFLAREKVEKEFNLQKMIHQTEKLL